VTDHCRKGAALPERAQLAFEPADKPGSVPRRGRGGGHPSRTTVARRLVQPTRRSTGASRPDLPTANRRQDSLLLGLAPGGGCLAGRVTTAAGALLPHRFTLAGRVGPPLGRDRGRQYASLLPSSAGSLRLAVSQHRALWSPDFPQPGRHPRCRGEPGRDHLADSNANWRVAHGGGHVKSRSPSARGRRTPAPAMAQGQVLAPAGRPTGW